MRQRDQIARLLLHLVAHGATKGHQCARKNVTVDEVFDRAIHVINENTVMPLRGSSC